MLIYSSSNHWGHDIYISIFLLIFGCVNSFEPKKYTSYRVILYDVRKVTFRHNCSHQIFLHNQTFIVQRTMKLKLSLDREFSELRNRHKKVYVHHQHRNTWGAIWSKILGLAPIKPTVFRLRIPSHSCFIAWRRLSREIGIISHQCISTSS